MEGAADFCYPTELAPASCTISDNDRRIASIRDHRDYRSSRQMLRTRERHALSLRPSLLEDVRNLILDVPKIRSVVIKGGCRCFPRGYLTSCRSAIQQAFTDRLAAQTAQAAQGR